MTEDNVHFTSKGLSFIEKYNKIIFLAIVFLGLAIRLYYYLLNSSLWLDEASLAINAIYGSYLDLFKGLDLLQACPPVITVLSKLLVDIFHTENIFIRDLILRFIPFASGIASIFAFYYLIKNVFKDNKVIILTALAFFALNPAAITYSVQFKQYSTELLFSIILLTLFYKLITENKIKWYYFIIISIAPWFSYSSFFIIASGLLMLLFKDRKNFLLVLIPVCFSSLIYYLVSLRYVFALNYAGMDEYWSKAYSFLTINHPTRVLYRIGDLFTFYKYPALIAGLICFVSGIYYLINKNNNYLSKILFTSPIILTMIASVIHKYPFCCRLILFLVPVFLILVVSCERKWGSILKIIFGLIFVVSIFNYTPDAREYCYTYSRDIINYINAKIKKTDIILLDSMNAEYVVYLNQSNIDNHRIVLPESCLFENIDRCTIFLTQLPAGNYYFLASSYYTKEIVEKAGLKPVELDLDFKPKKCKAVYFEK